MLLQYPDTIPPVLHVEVIVQAIPRVGGPRVAWEGAGAGASLSQPWKAHIAYLGLLYRLTDRNPDPIDCRLCPVHVMAV